MTVPPFIITPNGAGEAVQSAALTISTSAGTTCLPGDVMTVGVAVDGDQAIASVAATGFGAFVRVWDGSSGSGILAVTASIWAGICLTPVSNPAISALATAPFDDCGLMFAITRGQNVFHVFDPNLGLPAVTTGSTVTFDTNHPDDLVLFFNFGHSGMWLGPPPAVLGPSDWVYQTGFGNSGGAGFIGGSLYARSFTSTQINAVADPLIAVNGDTFFVVIAFTANASSINVGTPVTINAPPPVPLPCVAPCTVCFDANSHAARAWCGTIPG